MSIYLENRNKHVQPPRDFIPICTTRILLDYWLPGAKALGLDIVSLFENLFINAEQKNTDWVPRLIEELKKLREWFVHNAPESEHKYLLSRTDRLIEELTLIEKEGDINIFIG
jgi:hypothetical protein